MFRAVAMGTWQLLRGTPVEQARIVVADGVLSMLSFTLAATLLNSVLIHTWQQIFTFGAIVILRVVLGQLFCWERAHARVTPTLGH